MSDLPDFSGRLISYAKSLPCHLSENALTVNGFRIFAISFCQLERYPHLVLEKSLMSSQDPNGLSHAVRRQVTGHYHPSTNLIPIQHSHGSVEPVMSSATVQSAGLISEITRLKAHTAHLITDKDALAAQNTHLQAHIASLEAQIAQLEALITEPAAHIARLEERNVHLMRYIYQLEAHLSL